MIVKLNITQPVPIGMSASTWNELVAKTNKQMCKMQRYHNQSWSITDSMYKKFYAVLLKYQHTLSVMALADRKYIRKMLPEAKLRKLQLENKMSIELDKMADGKPHNSIMNNMQDYQMLLHQISVIENILGRNSTSMDVNTLNVKGADDGVPTVTRRSKTRSNT